MHKGVKFVSNKTKKTFFVISQNIHFLVPDEI